MEEYERGLYINTITDIILSKKKLTEIGKKQNKIQLNRNGSEL